MPTSDKLAELTIKEHESRLKHIDELMEKAESAGKKSESTNREIEELKQERQKMGDYVDSLKEKSPQEFMETAGPMVMWELVAKKLEQLIEKIKKGA